jgi:hypothetical protein
LTLNSGQGLIVYDRERIPLAYGLFRKHFDENGLIKTIALHQCIADPTRHDAASIFECALSHVFSPLSAECHRSTYNFNKSNHVVMDLLQKAGFTTFIEQVMMKKDLTL